MAKAIELIDVELAYSQCSLFAFERNTIGQRTLFGIARP